MVNSSSSNRRNVQDILGMGLVCFLLLHFLSNFERNWLVIKRDFGTVPGGARFARLQKENAVFEFLSFSYGLAARS